jgi:hypothetical protein
VVTSPVRGDGIPAGRPSIFPWAPRTASFVVSDPSGRRICILRGLIVGKAHSRRASYRLVGTVGVAGLVLGLAGPVLAASGGGGGGGGGKVTDAGSQAAELMTSMSQRDAVRTAPTGQVAPGAYDAAWTSFAALAPAARSWADITNVPYNADAPN